MKKNPNNLLTTAVFSLTLMLLTRGVFAGGLVAGPAKYAWKNVSPGKKTAMPIEVYVKNTTKVVGSYLLRAVIPEDIKAKPDKGFGPLPLVKWISFDRKYIVINPGETLKVKVFIQIPDEEQYQKGKWQFYIEVKEYAGLGKMFALACYLKIKVITKGTVTAEAVIGKPAMNTDKNLIGTQTEKMVK